MIKEQNRVHEPVIRRLPRYRRYLEELSERKIELVSSDELSVMTGYTPSLIRKDLINFGSFGKPREGYNVAALFDGLNYALGVKTTHNMIIVGVGNQGQSIIKNTYYCKMGFNIVGLFDINPNLIGLRVNNTIIRDAKELEVYLKENVIDIGIISTPKYIAQHIADVLSAGEVKGILNFAPVDIRVPQNVCVQNIHVCDSLNLLSYAISEKIKKVVL